MSSNKQQVIHGDVTAVTEVATQAPTERAREVLMAELCGLGATLTSAMEASPDFVPCGHAFGELIAGLYGAVVSDDEAALTELADTARARSEHVAEHRGVTQAAAVFPKLDDANAALVCAALRGIAADAWRAMRLGSTDDGVNVLLANALAALGAGVVSDDLVVRAGRAAFAAAVLAGSAR